MPRLGTNGGLIGPRRVATTGNASGSWALDEQCDAVRQAIWPIVAPPNPIPALAPVLWYDFADEATVTTSSGEITQIADKGSANRTLTKSSIGPTYATTINGKKVSNWGTSYHSNYLRNNSATSYNVAEIYIVADSSETGDLGSSYAALATTLSTTDIFLNAWGTGFEGPFGLFNRIFLNGGTANRFSSIFPEIESPCILRAVNNADAVTTTTDGFQIGMDRGNPTRGWRGLIGEVICFPSVLNSTNRAAVENYLSEKWGITLEGQGNG